VIGKEGKKRALTHSLGIIVLGKRISNDPSKKKGYLEERSINGEGILSPKGRERQKEEHPPSPEEKREALS